MHEQDAFLQRKSREPTGALGIMYESQSMLFCTTLSARHSTTALADRPLTFGTWVHLTSTWPMPNNNDWPNSTCTFPRISISQRGGIEAGRLQPPRVQFDQPRSITSPELGQLLHLSQLISASLYPVP